jgi:hypothetical protein
MRPRRSYQYSRAIDIDPQYVLEEEKSFSIQEGKQNMQKYGKEDKIALFCANFCLKELTVRR